MTERVPPARGAPPSAPHEPSGAPHGPGGSPVLPAPRSDLPDEDDPDDVLLPVILERRSYGRVGQRQTVNVKLTLDVEVVAYAELIAEGMGIARAELLRRWIELGWTTHLERAAAATHGEAYRMDRAAKLAAEVVLDVETALAEARARLRPTALREAKRRAKQRRSAALAYERAQGAAAQREVAEALTPEEDGRP